MSNILIVIGSARPNSVAGQVAGYVKKDIEGRDGATATIADLKTINLPFFDNPQAPASPDYAATDPQVIAWSDMVKAADSIVFMTPEYNHTLSGIQKNAIDSLGAEWVDKPVTAVAYGWGGGSLSLATLREVMTHLKADLKQDLAQLSFMKDISPDGSIIDETNVAAQISTAIDAVA